MGGQIKLDVMMQHRIQAEAGRTSDSYGPNTSLTGKS